MSERIKEEKEIILPSMNKFPKKEVGWGVDVVLRGTWSVLGFATRLSLALWEVQNIFDSRSERRA